MTTIEATPNYSSPDLSKIVESSGSPISITLQNAVVSMGRYIARHRSGFDSKPFRGKQMTAFEKIRNFFKDGGSEGSLELPTGSGKTAVFCKCIDAIRPKKALLVEPTILLVDKTGREVEQFTEDIDVGKIYSHAQEYGAQVTITTYNSLVEKIRSGKIKPEEYDLLILDEIHEALSNERKDAVRLFTNAIKLGFTATAEYSEHKKVSDLLKNEIYRVSIREAVQEGMISGFQVFIVSSKAELSKVEVLKNGEFNQRQLQKAIDTRNRNMQALDLCLNYEYNGIRLIDQKTQLFCAGVTHATNAAKLFKENGLRAEVISGRDSRARQREILDKFEKGEIDKLFSADLLYRGIHVPGTSVCINLVPVLSPGRAKQRAGRVLGIDPSNPSKMALIFDFLDLNSERGTSRVPISFAEVAGEALISNHSDTIGKLRKIEDVANTRNIASNGRLLSGEIVVFEDEFGFSDFKVVAEPEEVMRIVREHNLAKKVVAFPSEGSITIHDFAVKHHVHDNHVGKMLQNAALIADLENHPEYSFKEFLGGNGKVITYISAELSARLEQDLENMRRIEAGWHNENEILKIANELLKVGWLKVRKSIETVKKFDEFKDMVTQTKISPNNVAAEYYPPDFINAVLNSISEKKNSFSPPLPGWTTNPGLARELGVTPKVASRLVKKYSKDRPGSVRKFKFEKINGQGAAGIYECISPELKKLIVEKEGGLGYAPEGYTPVSVLDKELGIDAGTIIGYLDSHPEWFMECRTKTRLRTLSVSPEGIANIRSMERERKAA